MERRGQGAEASFCHRICVFVCFAVLLFCLDDSGDDASRSVQAGAARAPRRWSELPAATLQQRMRGKPVPGAAAAAALARFPWGWHSSLPSPSTHLVQAMEDDSHRPSVSTGRARGLFTAPWLSSHVFLFGPVGPNSQNRQCLVPQSVPPEASPPGGCLCRTPSKTRPTADLLRFLRPTQSSRIKTTKTCDDFVVGGSC